jgi:hypothetical protein
MRIKIDGPVSEARLAQALGEAAIMLGNAEAVFYNANLYVTAFDQNGDILDRPNRDLMIHLPLLPGDSKSPPVSAEVKRARADLRRAELQAAIDVKAAHAAIVIEQQRQIEIANEYRKRERQASYLSFQRRIDQFQSLVRAVGATNLIDKLNETVSQAWHTSRPIISTGKNKGDERPMPIFAWIGGGEFVLFRNPDRTSAIKLRSPVGAVDKYGVAVRFWQYTEWSKATEDIQNMLNVLAKSSGLPVIEHRIVEKPLYGDHRMTALWC